jgi:hypothetical protein
MNCPNPKYSEVVGIYVDKERGAYSFQVTTSKNDYNDIEISYDTKEDTAHITLSGVFLCQTLIDLESLVVSGS